MIRTTGGLIDLVVDVVAFFSACFLFGHKLSPKYAKWTFTGKYDKSNPNSNQYRPIYEKKRQCIRCGTWHR